MKTEDQTEDHAHQIPNEDILPDDYPIYGGFFYVADGKPVISDWYGIIPAREFKLREKITELRRCNIAYRQRNG